MDMFLRGSDNFDVRKREDGLSESGAETTQTFNNGVAVTGTFSSSGVNGRAVVVFPEGSQMVGEFRNSVLESAQIQYVCGPQVIAQFGQTQDTSENFMENFTIKFASEYSVEGIANRDGVLESAQVYDPRRALLAEFKGANLEVREAKGDVFIIVSAIWIYEGRISSKREEISKQPLFLGPGVQIWNRGVGYYHFEALGQLTRKSILRFNRNLEIYRQTLYRGPVFEKSVTIYGNGLMFVTGNDYFNGDLVFLLDDNRTISFKAKLDEYWHLRAGMLFLDPADAAKRINFKKRDRRLLFVVEEQELDLRQFKFKIASLRPK